MKSYLRYQPESAFGVIASPNANVSYDFSGNLAFTPAVQSVSVWNLRQAQQVCRPPVDTNPRDGPRALRPV